MNDYTALRERELKERKKKQQRKERRHEKLQNQQERTGGDLRSQLISKGLAPKHTPEMKALGYKEQLEKIAFVIHNKEKRLQHKRYKGDHEAILLYENTIREIAQHYLEVLERLLNLCDKYDLGDPQVKVPEAVKREWGIQKRASDKKEEKK